MGKALNKNTAIHLFHEGSYYNAFEFMGAHPGTKNRKRGMYFRVGKYKVSEIALTYCDEAWGRSVNNTMTNIINNIK